MYSTKGENTVFAMKFIYFLNCLQFFTLIYVMCNVIQGIEEIHIVKSKMDQRMNEMWKELHDRLVSYDVRKKI